MPARTLKALKASIRHWEEMSRTGWDKEQPGASRCALCRLHQHKLNRDADCRRCPVMWRTGKQYCAGTPYEGASAAWAAGNRLLANRPAFLKAAAHEAAFLRSLLPEGEGGTMNTNITPGPWQYDSLDSLDGDGHNAFTVTPQKQQGLYIADVGSEANARLIAAAPELLEALKTLYLEVADYVEVNSLGDVHHNRSMQLARDAIAKAEGRAA